MTNRVSLSKTTSVALVECGERRFLLGVANGGVNLVAELSIDDIAQDVQEAGGSPDVSGVDTSDDLPPSSEFQSAFDKKLLPVGGPLFSEIMSSLGVRSGTQ